MVKLSRFTDSGHQRRWDDHRHKQKGLRDKTRPEATVAKPVSRFVSGVESFLRVSYFARSGQYHFGFPLSSAVHTGSREREDQSFRFAPDLEIAPLGPDQGETPINTRYAQLYDEVIMTAPFRLG